jgi:hypothetical protein
MPIPALSDVMNRLLSRASAALTSAGFTVEQQFIYTGEPPFDVCGQLTVHLDNLNQTQTNPLGGLTGNRAVNRDAQIPAGDFVITWTACSASFKSGGRDPKANDYQVSSTYAVNGAWAIYRALSAEIRSKTLFSTIEAIGNVRLSAVEPVGVSGGVAAYTIGLNIVLA